MRAKSRALSKARNVDGLIAYLISRAWAERRRAATSPADDTTPREDR
jgi:hypothetical protein